MYVPPQALSSVCDSCAENNCCLDLTGERTNIRVVNLDDLNSALHGSGSISDCAILWHEREVFAIVELKGGQSSITADRVVEQIQGSLNMIDSLTEDQHVADYFPILLYRGKDPTTSLRGKLVQFRGQPRRIILGSCGVRLELMLRRWFS